MIWSGEKKITDNNVLELHETTKRRQAKRASKITRIILSRLFSLLSLLHWCYFCWNEWVHHYKRPLHRINYKDFYQRRPISKLVVNWASRRQNKVWYEQAETTTMTTEQRIVSWVESRKKKKENKGWNWEKRTRGSLCLVWWKQDDK